MNKLLIVGNLQINITKTSTDITKLDQYRYN